jgi:hypothetical protein
MENWASVCRVLDQLKLPHLNISWKLRSETCVCVIACVFGLWMFALTKTTNYSSAVSDRKAVKLKKNPRTSSAHFMSYLRFSHWKKKTSCDGGSTYGDCVWGGRSGGRGFECRKRHEFSLFLNHSHLLQIPFKLCSVPWGGFCPAIKRLES